jgi:hypothetical protein
VRSSSTWLFRPSHPCHRLAHVEDVPGEVDRPAPGADARLPTRCAVLLGGWRVLFGVLGQQPV